MLLRFIKDHFTIVCGFNGSVSIHTYCGVQNGTTIKVGIGRHISTTACETQPQWSFTSYNHIITLFLYQTILSNTTKATKSTSILNCTIQYNPLENTHLWMNT